MNELLRHPFPASPAPGTTQAADGLPRRAWTADELRRMVEAGIIDEGEPFELIGGELVAMAAKGIPHEALKQSLNLFWGKIRPEHILFGLESPLRLGIYDEPEPDFFLHSADIALADVKGPTVLLVVEVSDSSLHTDRTMKALRYAAQGVREYWIVNARTRSTMVLREPSETGYVQRTEIPETERLTPLHAPEMAVRFADLR
jgi:Uma2 family endonuclease